MLSVDVSNGLREELEALALKEQSPSDRSSTARSRDRISIFVAGDRWFHAASTIKVAVLLQYFERQSEGRLRLDDSLHVRNRFFSAADGSLFRVSQDRDATPDCTRLLDGPRRFPTLAHAMIAGAAISPPICCSILWEWNTRGTALREAEV